MINTKIVKISEDNIDEKILAHAADIIKSGGLVAFPTETVYGLGANALNSEACEKIFAAKGRPQDNPLIIHISDPSHITRFTDVKNEKIMALAEKVAHAYMPGPITVILKKASIIPDSVTSGLDSVAIRCPLNKIARKLIELAETPIAAPSANISGRPSPTSAEHVIGDLDGNVEMIIDGGSCNIGLESTIIALKEGTDGAEIVLLRPGAVTLEQLSSFGCRVSVDKAVTGKMADGEKPLAPGMKYRHYAPKAAVSIVDGSDNKVIDYFSEKLKCEKNAILCFNEDKIRLSAMGGDIKRIFTFGEKDDSSEQARELFERLRGFDKLDIEAVYARMPLKKGVGLAVYNRLLKACGFNIISLENSHE